MNKLFTSQIANCADNDAEVSMSTVPVKSDAFRFLDIRSPKLNRATDPKYTITRTLLSFPETAFEKELKGITRGEDYHAQLDASIARYGKPDKAVQPDEGFIKDLAKLEAILFDPTYSPEARLAKFLAVLPEHSPENDQTYFIDAAAAAWDKFLVALLFATAGQPVADDTVRQLSSILRVAVVIFAVRAKPKVTDLEVFSTASIQVSVDLFDPEKLQATRPIVDREPGDLSARTYQDQIAERLLLLENAAAELRIVLLARDYSVPAPPPPVAVDGAGGGAEVVASIAAQLFRVSILNSRLSASTRALLVAEFDATQQADSIDDVDILGATASIGDEIDRVGRELFRDARPAQVRAASQQLNLLQQELRTKGRIPTDKIKRLGLLVSPPTLGDAAKPGRGIEGVVNVLGVGDLKVVKQTLLRYDPGEVANIENVLAGQTKERTHSVKQSTEDTLVVEQEKSVSTERDLQSTDRFELSDESQNAIKEQRGNEAGVTVTASYGPVSISANTKFSDASSQEQSRKVSRHFAREVIDRSVEKVEQKVRQERTHKTTLEIEEINKYTQVAADKSIVGVYRWVDKMYMAQVHVYGKRMMLEFLLPEPAAVYLHSQSTQPPNPGAVAQPEPLSFKATDITRYNYATFAGQYGAEVDTPPPSVQITKFISRNNADTQQTKITLDDGWFGVTAGVSATWTAYPNGRLLILLADTMWDTALGTWFPQYIRSNTVGEIPLSVTSTNVSSYNVMGSVAAVPSDAHLEKWKLDTYKVIASAYQLRLSEYRDYLASQRRTESVIPVHQDEINREIERRELQRACIETLTQKHFDGPGAISDNPVTGWPEIDFVESARQGKVVSFFQQSFEWEQLTYVFYPYFWGRQFQWSNRLSASGGDQLFTRFLSAGFARVVVPVKPAHESDLAFFLATGIIWGGTEPPVVGDARYVSILDEIKESLDAPDGGVGEGEPWEVKVPTSLVILDDSGNLPSWPNAMPGQGLFAPSEKLCGGIPYNAAQWKDGRTVADAIRTLGYSIDSEGDQDLAIGHARGTIRALQSRFNQLGASVVVGQQLHVDGIVGPCTLRALTYFDAMRVGGKWPGV